MKLLTNGKQIKNKLKRKLKNGQTNLLLFEVIVSGTLKCYFELFASQMRYEKFENNILIKGMKVFDS